MTIPAIIHQLWIGPPMPEGMDADMDRFRDMHPEWKYELWDDKRVSHHHWENQNLIDNAPTISPSSPQQFVSDVCRYEILNKYGGVWIDADTTPHNPFDDLLDSPGWLAWVVEGRYLNNAIMGMPPHHPLMAMAISRLERNVWLNINAEGNSRRSGPRFITPLARSFSKGKIEFLPKSHFYPYLWDEPEKWGTDMAGEYATHWWHNKQRLALLDG